VAIVLLVLLLILDSNLIATYSIGIRIFSQDKEQMTNNSVLYDRSVCISNLMTYTLQTYIQNKDVRISPLIPDGANYYLKRCQQNEQLYS